jgi:PKD repeat protein
MKKLVVLFVFVFIKANLYSNPPVTEFIAQINYINCDYAMAQFYYSVDTVFSDVISCWDFGDGVYYCNSYSNGASHNYSKPGIYSVTLKYIRNGDTIIISKPNLIVIRNPPIAEIDIDVNNKDSIFAPATIGFINKTKKGDGDTLSYLWSFGDSYISNDTNPIHTFIKPNTYYVDLKVTDNSGSQPMRVSEGSQASAPACSHLCQRIGTQPRNPALVVAENVCVPFSTRKIVVKFSS